MIVNNFDSHCGMFARLVYQAARKLIFLQTQNGRAYPSRLPLKMLQYSADHGHVTAMSQLGGLLVQSGVGRAVKRSGLEYIRCAAKNDDSQAQFMLGKAYYKGQVINQDMKNAVHWLALAADKGHSEAAKYLDACQNESSEKPANRSALV